MKKLFLLLLLAAPVLFSSCSKEETTVVSLDPFAGIEFDKRLAVTNSDLLKFQVMQNITNGNVQYLLFKNDVAGYVVADMNGKPTGYIYFTNWAVSGNTLTMRRDNGTIETFEVSKQYSKTNANSYTVTVYVKDSKGEVAYSASPDGGQNSSLAAELWNIIEVSRNSNQ